LRGAAFCSGFSSPCLLKCFRSQPIYATLSDIVIYSR
jgi:hypothetical protein